MPYWLLYPPIAFLIVWGAMTLLELACRRIAAPCSPETEGKTKSYACGETPETSRIQPDYSQFFPFAFFFTIMHVVALVVATVPRGKVTAIVLLYFLSAVCGLFILFRETIQSGVDKLFGKGA